MTLRLSQLNIYPIKSAGGIALQESEVDQFGLQFDRRWMVVDNSGGFLTQRSHPRLALVRPRIDQDKLLVDAPGMPTLELPLLPSFTVATEVQVWDDRCEASWLGERPARWFSELLDASCGLVFMSEEVIRRANPAYAPDGIQVSFADGFPFLLISEESLRDLNSRLSDPLPMNRFRPNLVVSGGEPYAEDGWRGIRVGDIPMSVVKPCGRCVVTTTDQETGERGREPLRTLATYRRRDGAVMFGQNVVHRDCGRLRVGDVVTVAELLL